MSTQAISHIDEILASFQVTFNVSQHIMQDFTTMEIILGESLLTPGLQTSVRVHSRVHNNPVKNLDEFKGSDCKIRIERPILDRYGVPTIMNVQQVTYRLDNRKLHNNNTEEFIIHACDQTLLDDAATLVSKYWKCTTPSAVVDEVLASCAGARNLDIESSAPARDYVAENIHPFQVVAQQANAALAAGNDPSFVHYMTYENLGTHHFRSLYSLTRQNPMFTYYYNEVASSRHGAGYGNPFGIMTYSFPCDFDLLSDILNGVDANGNDINSLFTFNPLTKSFNIFGNKTFGCGIGGGVAKTALSNQGSAQNQNSCPDYTHLYLQKRQARMALLEQDKIALRMTVPWNPMLHAGKVVKLELINKEDPTNKAALNYGSGDYLIVSIKHNIKYGGFATTMLDCVSTTVGQGGIV
jgi:hypothetical protein